VNISECTKPSKEDFSNKDMLLTSTCKTKVDVRTLIPISCTMTDRLSGEVMELPTNPDNPCNSQECSPVDFVRTGANWRMITTPFQVSSHMSWVSKKTQPKDRFMNFSRTYKTSCYVVDRKQIP